MTTDALRASYVDFKLVKTRSVAQLIFEVEIEQAETALDFLGIPQPGRPTWVGIAVLREGDGTEAEIIAANGGQKDGFFAGLTEEQKAAALAHDGPDNMSSSEPPAGRPTQHPLVRRAGILANDARFRTWVEQLAPAFPPATAYFTGDFAAQFIRDECGIASRKELANNPEAAAKFEALVSRYRQETGQSTWERPL